MTDQDQLNCLKGIAKSITKGTGATKDELRDIRYAIADLANSIDCLIAAMVDCSDHWSDEGDKARKRVYDRTSERECRS